MPIYTRTGDDGTTALFGGKRVLKCEDLVDIYGSVDELNSYFGLIISKLDQNDLSEFLILIQEDLFTIGSFLAGWQGELTYLQNQIDRMEKLIDRTEKDLPKLSNFILPGGSELGSLVHIARAITRRVERQYVQYIKSLLTQASKSQNTKSNNISQKLKIKNEKLIIIYLNRLSDLLFVMARYINKQDNKAEKIWKTSG